ncbi:ATPase [Mycolicibacterium sp. ND9-15]|uniref:ATPase n=1 Tax=Mycolicibacterium sp. ND9-15 TaxID=3042320 RepID=UPI002DDBA428|nr:ATPase [Mycolicibacterium sp. ND9-15]WSE54781.1 ATPase [Mycolicibacterium sp. ND9-15]
MRLLLAVAVAALGLAVAPGPPADAVPGVCPPICDAIPDPAWPVSSSLPLYSVYRWPGLAGLAVTAPAPRFMFEELCSSPPAPADPRDYVVAARAQVANPAGQWQLRAQVLHWRGDVAHNAPLTRSVLDTAESRLRTCQMTAPLASPSVTTADAEQLAAVISVAGQKVVHQYLLAHPTSGSIVELAMWSAVPVQVPWAAPPDAQVFQALAGPLCEAYLGSCR